MISNKKNLFLFLIIITVTFVFIKNAAALPYYVGMGGDVNAMEEIIPGYNIVSSTSDITPTNYQQLSISAYREVHTSDSSALLNLSADIGALHGLSSSNITNFYGNASSAADL